mgnify:CR=1 FL=1|jgi:hypothetical protein
MKKLLKIVLVSSLSLLCFSCYYDDDLMPEVAPIDENTVVKFSTDIIPIFDAYNCAGCHNENRDPDLRAGRELNSLLNGYVTAGNANDSKLFTTLNGGHQGVDANSLALIEKWINDGALNN